MPFDRWVVGQLAFVYTFHKIEPAKIVDKIVDSLVEVMVPGRGTGSSNWFMKGLRSLEQSAERTSREMDLRNELRKWDEDYPLVHHELIVRYVCAFAASTLAVTVLDILRPRSSSSSRASSGR
mmetsp:Transcript_36426/g.55986  ORF Transcript_36426/g.55986 Transcript_36426/m.55986 type:complete len:123 (+) Transcript_36426:172-540(+)